MNIKTSAQYLRVSHTRKVMTKGVMAWRNGEMVPLEPQHLGVFFRSKIYPKTSEVGESTSKSIVIVAEGQ